MNKPLQNSLAGGLHDTGRARLRLTHLLYGTGLLASAIAVFGLLSEPLLSPHDLGMKEVLTYGSKGLAPGLAVLGGWLLVWLSKSRALALAKVVGSVFLLSVVWNWLFPAPSCPRGAANRQECNNNLKQIGQALASYMDVHGTFPPAYLSDERGLPIHSWRVLLLPFLGHKRLYEKYDFNEPWNGPSNKLLVTQMPSEYRCPSRYGMRNPSCKTSYLAVLGPGTMWPDGESRRLEEVRDRPADTLVLVEADPSEVTWMEPRDLCVDDAVRFLSSTERRHPHAHVGGGNMLHADGLAQFHVYGRPTAYWEAMFTVNGGDEYVVAVSDETRNERSWSGLAKNLSYGVFVLLSFLPLPWVWLGRDRRIAERRDHNMPGDIPGDGSNP